MAVDRFGIDTDKIISGDSKPDEGDLNVSQQVQDNLKSIPRHVDETPIKSKDPIGAPGFWSSAAHSFAEENDVINVVKGFSHAFSHIPPDENEKFEPVKGQFELFKNTNEKYWGRLASATGSEDQKKILNWINIKEQEDTFYDNGSFGSTLVGGLGGGMLSLSGLTAMSATVKYARLADRVFKNAAMALPSVATGAIGIEASKQAANSNHDMSELAFNTLRDTAFGFALIGGGHGLGKAFEGHKMYRSNKSLDIMHSGAKIEQDIENGVIVGNKVVPAKGQTLSSAKVDYWQDVIDNSLVLEGAFAIPVLGKMFTKINPVVKGLSHSYATVRMWTNKTIDHSLNIVGIKKGKIRGDNFDELILDVRELSKMMDFEIKGAWHEELGINSKLQGIRAFEAFSQKINSDGYITLSEFNHKVQGIILTDKMTESKVANDMAQKVMDHLDKTWVRLLDALGLPKDYMPPRTARNYLMKNYNKEMISQDEPLWIKTTANYLLKADNKINELNMPVDMAKEELDKLIELKSLDPQNDKMHADAIKEQRKILNAEKRKLEDELRDNPDLSIYLEKRSILNSGQAREAEKLNKPKDKIIKKLQKENKIIADLNAEISKQDFFLQSTSTPAKTRAAEAKKLAAEQELKPALERKDILDEAFDKEEQRIHQLSYEDNMSDAAKEATEKAVKSVSGKAGKPKKIDKPIDKRLTVKNKAGTFVIRNVKEDAPKLRKVFEDDNARMDAAEAWGNTIQGLTPEQLNQSLLAQLVPQSGENPIKKRTLMVPDEIYHDTGFLSDSLAGNIATYDLAIGRVTAMHEVFKDLGDESPVEYIGRMLLEERKYKRARLYREHDNNFDGGTDKENAAAKANFEAKKLTPEKLKKALAEIESEYKDAVKFINNSHNMIMGRTNASLTTQRMTSILRNFAVTTMLGNVPLTQIADLGGLILKNGIWRFIRDGLEPLLRSAASGFKGEHAESRRMNAAHVHLATEHINSTNLNKNFNPLVAQDDSRLSKAAAGMEKLAGISGNVFGTTYVDNALQTMSATMTQAKVMEWMYKHIKGELRTADKETLLRAGINPGVWAKRFIENFEKTGERSWLGSYNSKWYNWADTEAQLVMGRAIKRTLRETILKRGVLDNPFFTNDPSLNLLMLFKGWIFSATSRYTLPLLQHGEAKDLISIVTGLAIGSLVDPLRRLARGEPIEYNSPGAYIAALGHSGVLGYIHEIAEIANAFSGEKFYSSGDKYKRRVRAGMLLGPAGGAMDSLIKIVSAVAQNKITEDTAMKTVKAIPLSQASYLRYLTSHFVQGLGLPKGSGNGAAPTSNNN
ncbi:MAG: hypothetical protein QNK36_10490 [Colwellia sp.]|nr:hypothetical protein [Colwellia sp.]